ncbi:hypothetical protein HID58_082793, partial [Brassica napus]
DLITTSPYKHWNPVALQSYLCDEDQRLVSQIYLSQTEKEDNHTRDGNYTVSSGYKPPIKLLDMVQQILFLKIVKFIHLSG